MKGVGGAPGRQATGGGGVVAQDAHVIDGSVHHAGNLSHGQGLSAAVGAGHGSHGNPTRAVPFDDTKAAGSVDFAASGHDESVHITVGQGGLLGTVAEGEGSEGAVAQKQVDQSAAGVHHHVQHTTFVFEIIHVDDVGVVVGVKEHQFVVGRQVQHAVVGVHGRGTQVEVVGCQRDQRVGRGEHFDDHLGHFSVRGQVPACARVAVGVQAPAVGAPGRETAGFAQGAEASPVEHRGPEPFDDQLRFFSGHSVLATRTDFERDVGEDGTGRERQVPVGRGPLTGLGHGTDGVKETHPVSLLPSSGQVTPLGSAWAETTGVVSNGPIDMSTIRTTMDRARGRWLREGEA